MKLYAELADQIGQLIESGTLQPGDRLTSIRELCRERHVSPATAIRAYQQLEARGFIETRPRSGFYVSSRWQVSPPEPRRSRPPARTTRVAISDLVFEILAASRDRDVVPLGSAFPSPHLFPLRKLARYLGNAAKHMDPWSTVQSLPPGNAELRRQIARRYLRSGCRVSADEIVITSGALEALNLSLQVLTQPGDTVAIESPAFYGCLQAIEALGLKALEIPTHPREGVDLPALAQALERQTVRACWLMTTFQNPLGATLPTEKKAELVKLLAKHGVPLIEDDVYAELHFGHERPQPAKAFDKLGTVLNCGSFSKNLAPGYRLGWVAAGQFAERIQRRKTMTTLATSIPVQEAIAAFLRDDGYDSHLRKLRRQLELQQAAALRSLSTHLPAGYRTTRPAGGYFLWVELPAEADAIGIHRRALEQGVSVAPGPIFSARRGFQNCLRLNTGHPWTDEMDRGIAAVARIIRSPGS